jgi:hypothetical protein
MELPGSAYLYTLATLAMTFAGFCAIVIVLRQTTGKGISGFHLVLTRLYLESGLFSAAFCMLPPLLALCGLPETTVWRVSSAIIATVLLCFGATYPMRRAAITAGSLPSTRWMPIVSTSMLVVVALLAPTEPKHDFAPQLDGARGNLSCLNGHLTSGATRAAVVVDRRADADRIRA